MNRHQKELSIRQLQHLTKSRAAATEKVIRAWFENTKTYYKLNKLEKIEASQVFNFDESAFMLYPKEDCMLVKRGKKRIYKVIEGDEK